MNLIGNLTLIEGEFSVDEAKGILINIFSSKINYHHLKNWSSQERFGKYDITAQKRIPALIIEMKKLEDILSQYKHINNKLVVKSEISISMYED
ncbi:MAG TPA: hypothetical protein PK076_08355 [Saprospiraceae bacterium]|nr:hypothetical protein [Saprospiraceae bacterium]